MGAIPAHRHISWKEKRRCVGLIRVNCTESADASSSKLLFMCLVQRWPPTCTHGAGVRHVTKIQGSSQSFFFLSCSPSHRLTNQRQGRRWSSWCDFPLSSLPRVILAGAFLVVRNCKPAVLVFVTHAQGLTLPGGNGRLRMGGGAVYCRRDGSSPPLGVGGSARQANGLPYGPARRPIPRDKQMSRLCRRRFLG